MTKAATYRAQLRALESWDAWLQQESSLPGPRANLELIAAVAEEGGEAFFPHCLALDSPATMEQRQSVRAACCCCTL